MWRNEPSAPDGGHRSPARTRWRPGRPGRPAGHQPLSGLGELGRGDSGHHTGVEAAREQRAPRELRCRWPPAPTLRARAPDVHRHCVAPHDGRAVRGRVPRRGPRRARQRSPLLGRSRPSASWTSSSWTIRPIGGSAATTLRSTGWNSGPSRVASMSHRAGRTRKLDADPDLPALTPVTRRAPRSARSPRRTARSRTRNRPTPRTTACSAASSARPGS
jgi:hypothetical protein